MRTQRPEIDPSALLFFARVARAGGIRRAVASVGAPRSTVSRRLVELERQVGAPLVVRTSRRFALTELGTALAEQCGELEDALRRTEELVSRSAQEPSGKLRIAAAPMLGEQLLPQVIAELTRLYPRLTFEVKLSHENVDLRRGDVDVALRVGPLDDATDLFATRVGASTAGCWVSSSYAKLRGIPKIPADLARHECILVGGAARSTWTFGGARHQSVSVSGSVRVEGSRMALGLAVHGAGVARGPRFLADPLVESGALIPVLERYWLDSPLHAVHAGPNPAPQKIRVFIERARNWYKTQTA